jgi:hypothetical protein
MEMENNVGILLHKLTKYQTLLANSNQSSKINTYEQKINQYTTKLENLGINKSTLTQIGGLASGSFESMFKERSENVTKKIKELKESKTNDNEKNKYDFAVINLQNSVDNAQKTYTKTISELIDLTRTMMKKMDELEKDIASLSLPEGITWGNLLQNVSQINDKLQKINIDKDNKPINVIAEPYFISFVNDINNVNETDLTKDKDKYENEVKQLNEMIKSNDLVKYKENLLIKLNNEKEILQAEQKQLEEEQKKNIKSGGGDEDTKQQTEVTKQQTEVTKEQVQKERNNLINNITDQIEDIDKNIGILKKENLNNKLKILNLAQLDTSTDA